MLLSSLSSHPPTSTAKPPPTEISFLILKIDHVQTTRFDTNIVIQKDAFVLAKELIDVRRPVSLEAALLSPFMTENTTGEMSYSAHWNGM